MRIRDLFFSLAAPALAAACSTSGAARAPAEPAVPPPLPLSKAESDTSSSSLSLLPASEPESSATAAPSGTISAPHGFVSLFKRDLQHFVTAPLRWERSDWLKLGIGVLAVGGALVLDEELRHFVESNTNQTTRSLARTFEPFGAEYSWGALGAFSLAGRLFKSEKAAAVAEDGFASSLIAAGVITPILKATIGRRRPSQTEGTFALGEGGTSFPSGHTTQAFAVASVIASHHDSLWVKIASYGVAGLVGLARMEDNAHYASDVLAGALIGIIVGDTVVRLHDAERFSISVAPSVNPASPGVALGVRIGLDDVLGLFRDD